MTAKTRLYMLGVLLMLVAGCERKLPGPDECVRMSARILGLEDERMLLDASIKQRYDDLTVRCLTTPFDAELVRCLDESRDARQCLYRFQDRRTRRSVEERTSP